MNNNVIKENIKNLKKIKDKDNSIKALIKEYKILLGIMSRFSLYVDEEEKPLLEDIDEDSLKLTIDFYKKYFKQFPYIYGKEIRDIIYPTNFEMNKHSNKELISVLPVDSDSLFIEEENFLFSINEEFFRIYSEISNKGLILIKPNSYVSSYTINDKYNKTTTIFISQQHNIEDILNLSRCVFDAIKNKFTKYEKPQNEAQFLVSETFNFLCYFLLLDFYKNNYSRKILMDELFNDKLWDISTLISLSKEQIRLFDMIKMYSTFGLNNFDVLVPYCSLSKYNRILDLKYNEHVSDIISFFMALEFYLQFKDNKEEFIKNIHKFFEDCNLSDLKSICENCNINYGVLGSKEKTKLLQDKAILFK